MTIHLQSAQTITDYTRHLRTRRLSPATIRSAKSILHCLGVAVDGGDILRLDGAQLADWQAVRAEQLSARSLRTQCSAVRCFYGWTLAEGRRRDDPSTRLQIPKVPRLLPRPITEEDFAQALAAADRTMGAVLSLAGFAGLRAAEICSLDWSDIQLGTEPYARVVGKGSRERIVDLSPDLLAALLLLPTRRGPVIRRRDGQAGRVTPNRMSQMGGRYLRSCGIEVTLHQLRHRFGTITCRLGGIRVAQEALGHASPMTTAGYAAVARRELRPVIVQAGRIQAS